MLVSLYFSTIGFFKTTSGLSFDIFFIIHLLLDFIFEWFTPGTLVVYGLTFDCALRFLQYFSFLRILIPFSNLDIAAEAKTD